MSNYERFRSLNFSFSSNVKCFWCCFCSTDTNVVICFSFLSTLASTPLEMASAFWTLNSRFTSILCFNVASWTSIWFCFASILEWDNAFWVCSLFGRFGQSFFSKFDVGVLNHPLVDQQSLPVAPFVCRHAPTFHKFSECNLAPPESISSQDYLRLFAKYGSSTNFEVWQRKDVVGWLNKIINS